MKEELSTQDRKLETRAAEGKMAAGTFFFNYHVSGQIEKMRHCATDKAYLEKKRLKNGIHNMIPVLEKINKV